MDKKICKYITYKEATHSATAKRKGITNQPDSQQLENMKMIGVECFDPAREHFGKPIFVNSFFRCVTLNSVLGGSSSSQHTATNGAAIDADTKEQEGFSNADLFHYWRQNIEFDQLIWEFGDNNEPDWVHISKKKADNRGQILKAKRVDGVTRYETLNFE